MNRTMKYLQLLPFVAAAGFLLAACGGGGGGSSNPVSPAVTASGTLTKGSFSVNGLKDPRPTLAGATIRVDDNTGTEDELRDGMQVKIKAHKIADDPLTPEVEIEIEKIEAEPEVRGQVENRGADDFTVNGQHVIVDDQTEFEHRMNDGSFDPTPIDFTSIQDAFEVEVHGGRDDLGSIRATRVEWREDGPVDEIKGPVSGPVDATTFFLGAQQVDYSATGVAQSELTVGRIVEAHGSLVGGVFVATSLDLEDVEDAEFEPAEGEELEVEGFVGALSGSFPAFQFQVGTVDVVTDASTVYRNGSRLDLGNNVKVEVEGHFSQATSILTATKIEFKRSQVILEGTPTSLSPLVILGKTVQSTSATEDNRTGSVRVHVQGFEDGSGNVVAEKIDDAGGGRDILQAQVTAKSGNILTMLGVEVDLGGITVPIPPPPEDPKLTNEETGAIYNSIAAFLADVTPGRTIVKAKGVFDSGPNPDLLTAEEAEIED